MAKISVVNEKEDSDYEDVSDVSDEELDEEKLDELIGDETLYERIVALKDILPPSQRTAIRDTFSTVSSSSLSTIFFLGRSLRIITSSILLLGAPLGLAFLAEQQQLELERESKASQGANDVLAPGADAGFGRSP